MLLIRHYMILGLKLIIFPNLSTFNGIQVSLIISPVMALSILFYEENSSFLIMGLATEYLMKKT